MIITRTPFRVSFVGGGSDLPSFYERHEGCVLSTSINKYMYITINPSFIKNETSLKYSQIELVDDIRNLKHPIASQLLQDYNLSGVEITSTSDLPSGTGLSSSSAYTVGLINAINAFMGKYRTQESIAEEACTLEIEKLNAPIGKQDQYGVAIGGLKFVTFKRNGYIDIEFIPMKEKIKNAIETNLMLFYTGSTRLASEILKEQNSNIINEKSIFENMIEMTKLAKKMKKSLLANDISEFGNILHESMQIKKQLSSKISMPIIDDYYERALHNGATGGKILGAGGGGFILLYCEPDKQPYVRRELRNLLELPFCFEDEGTKVIFKG